MRRFTIAVGLFLVGAVWFPGLGYGQFWDPGFNTARTRSDFGNFSSFTWSSCLYPNNSDSLCPTPAAVFGGDCPNCDRTYSTPNSYSVNYARQSSFWVLSHNIDAVLPGYSPLTAFTNHCLTGPPNQSWHVIPSGDDVFGVTYGNTGPNGALEWYLGLKTQFLPDCNGDGQRNSGDGTPYLSIGDDIRSGHPATSIGSFYSSQPGMWTHTGVTAWYRVIGINGVGGSLYYLLGISEWGGKTRGLFIYIGRRYHSGCPNGIDPGSGKKCEFRWNFPNSRSFWQKLPSTKANIGGADFAYINAEDLIPGYHIGGCNPAPDKGCLVTDGVSYQIQVNLAGAFEVANSIGLFDTPMPGAGTLKRLYGVHWAVESVAPSFSIGVSKMSTYSGYRAPKSFVR